MNLKKDTNLDLKSDKFRRKKTKRVTANFLSNICLTGLQTKEAQNTHFDSLIANDFDCFLSFHRINASPHSQTDYFNYYKLLIAQQLDGSTPRNLEHFIKSEFNQFEFSPEQNDFYRLYIESLMTRKKSSKYPNIPRSKPISIPNIKIQSSIIPEDVNDKSTVDYRQKMSFSDNETEKKTSYSVQQPSQSSSIQKLPGVLNIIIHSFPSSLKNKVRKAEDPSIETNEPTSKLMIIKETSDDFENSQDFLSHSTGIYLHPKNLSKNDRRIRAISESSDESNLSSSLNSNVNSIRNYKTHRPTLFNNLRRLTTERMILTSNNIPISIFSRLPFRSNAFKSDLNDSLKNTVPKASHNFISDVFDLFNLDFEEFIKKGEMSYENLIDPGMAQLKQSEEENIDENAGAKEDQVTNKKETLGGAISYQPDFLDNPKLTELTAGKNRTCLKFSSYTVSIIDYVKPLELKKEINETFKEKFPFVQITLTKLRSIKREMLEIGVECMLDLIIVAQSYVYFERLILQGLINKPNRKYLAANSLVLAAKLNDVTKKDISKLLEVIITKFRFDNKREIISYEFGILVALEFNLMIKHEVDFISHYDRLVAK